MSKRELDAEVPTTVATRLAGGQACSVTDLSQALRRKPEDIRSALDELATLGFPLEWSGGDAVQATHPVDLLDASDLDRRLGEHRARLASLEAHLQIGSTNDHLLDAGLEAAQPRACLAELQVAGRGRRGRSWHSPFGGNLYLSMSWQYRSPQPLAGLSLALGVAAAEALRAIGAADVAIKWPNDLLWHDRKLAGILVDVRGDWRTRCQVVAGIGVNVAMPRDAGRTIDQPWCDLAGILGRTPVRGALAAALIRAWLDAVDDYQRAGLAAFAPRYSSLDVYRGRTVTATLPDRVLSGIARGVAADGALLIERDGETHAVYAADVSLRLGGEQPDQTG